MTCSPSRRGLREWTLSRPTRHTVPGPATGPTPVTRNPRPRGRGCSDSGSFHCRARRPARRGGPAARRPLAEGRAPRVPARLVERRVARHEGRGAAARRRERGRSHVRRHGLRRRARRTCSTTSRTFRSDEMTSMIPPEDWVSPGRLNEDASRSATAIWPRTGRPRRRLPVDGPAMGLHRLLRRCRAAGRWPGRGTDPDHELQRFALPWDQAEIGAGPEPLHSPQAGRRPPPPAPAMAGSMVTSPPMLTRSRVRPQLAGPSSA